MREMRNTYKILVGKPVKEENTLETSIKMGE
jgi:hypothetical protein